MCLHSYSNKNIASSEMFPEEYELLKQIYTSIDNNNTEDTRSLTQDLINSQLEKGNENNISFLQEALNSFK